MDQVLLMSEPTLEEEIWFMLQMKRRVSLKVLLLLDIGEEFSTMLEDTGKSRL